MTQRTYYTILGLGALLRLILIWDAGMWYDENFSLMLARLPLVQMLAATAGDVHPPLYYLLIWPLGQIPDLPAWVLRVPSALFSIATLAIYPRLLTHLKAPLNVQLISFVLMAILPMQLHYAQEARMYALLELLFVVGALAIYEDRRIMLWAAATGMLYTQNYGLFYVVTLFLLVLSAYRFTEKGRSQSSHIVWAVIAWLPWVPVIRSQLAAIQGNYWIFGTTAGSVLYAVWKLFWGFSLNHPAGLMSSMIVTFAWVLLAIWYLLARRPEYWWEIALLGYGPLLMAVIASVLVAPMILPRPLIGITPFLYLSCAYPLGLIDSTRRRLFAAAFILPMLVTSLGGYYFFHKAQKEVDGNGDVNAVTAFIRERWQPGDVLYFAGDSPYVNYSPYLMDLPRYLKPDCAEHTRGALTAATRQAMGTQLVPFDLVRAHAERIWFMYIETPLLPRCELQDAEAITGGAAPVYVLRDEMLVYSALWLLDQE